MKGQFTVPSSKIHRSYKERTYDYEILQVDKENGQTVGEAERDQITEADLQDADRVFYRVTDHEGNEMYKWVAGPFPDQRGVEGAIEDIEVYGSPEPLPDLSSVQ